MRHPEDDLQAAVAELLDMLGWLYCHVPNGGKRNLREAARLKRMGVKAGIPDVLIFEPVVHTVSGSVTGFGLALELKIKPNRPTPEQIATLAALHERGWGMRVCYSMDDVMEALHCVRPLNGRRI